MRLSANQKDDIKKALNEHTIFGGNNNNYPRMKDTVVGAIDTILAQGEEVDHVKGNIRLEDSYIKDGEHRLLHRENLFAKLAEVLCDGDVFHWTHTRSGAPTEGYQDALFMVFSWESPQNGRAYKFFTRSSEPSPGFSRTVDWHLQIDHIPAHMRSTVLSVAQKTAMGVALSVYTRLRGNDINSVREKTSIITRIDRVVEEIKRQPIAEGCVDIDDSHINGVGTGRPYRERLFRELARILCNGDVAEWASTQDYQDAMDMEFSWKSPRTDKAYKFFTRSPEPEPGFVRSITWHLEIYRMPPSPPPTGHTTLSVAQKTAVDVALSTYTFYSSNNRNSVRAKTSIIDAIDRVLEGSDLLPTAEEGVNINDSHIHGAGRGEPHRENLFKELARILCDGDVTEWAKKQSGEPTEVYQDAMIMEFSWKSPRKAKAYKFFTHSPEQPLGCSRWIEWNLRITNDTAHSSGNTPDFDTGPLMTSLHARILALEESARISPW